MARLALITFHAGVVLLQSSVRLSAWEVLFYLQALACMSEELMAVYYHGFKEGSVWDIFGAFDYTATIGAFIMRVVAAQSDPNSTGRDFLDYSLDILSVTFIVACIRLLDLLAVLRDFGPLVIAIGRILIGDIIKFLTLLLLFLGGFAVAITSIFVIRNPAAQTEDGQIDYAGLEDLLWSVFGDWTLPISNADRDSS